MMEIFLQKVNYEIARAAEYLDLNVSKHSEGYRVQIESLQDSVSLFYIATAAKKSRCDDFSKVLADAQSMLRNLKCGLVRAESEEKLEASTSLTNSGMKSTVPHNLVEIPKFYGDPLQFRSFMTLFMGRVNCNSSFTDIDKFILLKNHLEGEAYDVINHIPITEKNFSLSSNILEEMYGNEERCIDALCNRMLTLPAVSTGGIAEIRKTYWNLEAILRSLEQYDKPINENWFLQSLYKEKFATVTELTSGEFSDFRKRVRHFIQTKEQNVSLVLSEKSFHLDVDSSVVTNERETSEIETTLTCADISSVPSNEIFECIFCLEKHCSEDCTVYPTIFQRKKQIQDRCFKCLRLQHGRKACVEFVKCEYCNENSHSRILCPQKCGTDGMSGGASEKLSDTLLASFSEDPKPTSSEPLTKDYFCPTTPLTTFTSVENPENGKTTGVRLVISSGSRSLVSESVIHRLGPKLKEKKSMVFSETNGEMPGVPNVMVNVLIHVKNGPPVPLNLLVVKEVCNKTVVTPTVAQFKKEHPHLKYMDFQDTGCGRPIEMLIGGDTELASVAFNRQLDSDDEENCPSVDRSRGWSLVSSMFGWIILGTDKTNEPIIFSLRGDY